MLIQISLEPKLSVSPKSTILDIELCKIKTATCNSNTKYMLFVVIINNNTNNSEDSARRPLFIV